MFQLLDQPRVQNFIGTEPYYIHKTNRFQKDDNPDISQNAAFTLSNPEVRQRYASRYTISSGLYFRSQPSLDSIISRIQEFASNL